jgi:hypothetical protein
LKHFFLLILEALLCATLSCRRYCWCRRADLALVYTDLAATPAELVCRYATRWGIEVTFSEQAPGGMGRPATAAAAPSSAPCRSACGTTASSSSGMPAPGHALADVATRRALAPWYRHE